MIIDADAVMRSSAALLPEVIAFHIGRIYRIVFSNLSKNTQSYCSLWEWVVCFCITTRKKTQSYCIGGL